MKAFIINLERSRERRKHMEELMKKNPYLDYEFFTAIDGKTLKDREKYFNIDDYQKEYSCKPLPGEIGVTLSNRKLYETIIKRGIEYCLILEDDIIIQKNEELMQILNKLKELLSTDTPTVILLTGRHWYKSPKKIDKSHKIVDIYDGFLACGYLINKKAAEQILKISPFYIADDWYNIRKKGEIYIKGVIPPLIFTEKAKFPSTVLEPRTYIRSAVLPWIKNKYRILGRYWCSLCGRFENTRIMNSLD